MVCVVGILKVSLVQLFEKVQYEKMFFQKVECLKQITELEHFSIEIYNEKIPFW